MGAFSITSRSSRSSGHAAPASRRKVTISPCSPRSRRYAFRNASLAAFELTSLVKSFFTVVRSPRGCCFNELLFGGIFFVLRAVLCVGCCVSLCPLWSLWSNCWFWLGVWCGSSEYLLACLMGDKYKRYDRRFWVSLTFASSGQECRGAQEYQEGEREFFHSPIPLCSLFIWFYEFICFIQSFFQCFKHVLGTYLVHKARIF